MNVNFNQADYSAIRKAIKLENDHCNLQVQYADTKKKLSELKLGKPQYSYKKLFTKHAMVPYKKLPYSEVYTHDNIVNLQKESRKSMLHEQIIDLTISIIISVLYTLFISSWEDIALLNWGYVFIVIAAAILLFFSWAKHKEYISVTLPDRVRQNDLVVDENKKIALKNKQLEQANLEIKKRNEPIRAYNERHTKEQDERAAKAYQQERSRLQKILQEYLKQDQNAVREKKTLLDGVGIQQQYRDVEHLQTIAGIMLGQQVSADRAQAMIEVQEKRNAEQAAKQAEIFRKESARLEYYVDGRMKLLQDHFVRTHDSMFDKIDHMERQFNMQMATLQSQADTQAQNF